MKKKSKNSISRREFNLRAAALAGAAALAVTTPDLHAQESASGTPAPQTPEDGLSAAERSEVEARFQNVIQEWGERLSSEQRERVHRILVENERMMQPIRSWKLENGDPPAPVLRVQP